MPSIRSAARWGRPEALLLALFLTACGGGGSEPGGSAPTATQLGFLTPPSTTAQSRSALTVQPVIQLLDADGGAVAEAGVTVTAQLAGGGALSGTTAAITNAQGQATFTTLALRGLAGPKTLSFSAPGVTGVSQPVTLTAGAPAVLAIAGGNGQVALVNAALPAAPAVRVTDADGNAVGGSAVTFAVTGGGGSIAGGGAVTTGAGIAAPTSWTLGGASGVNSATATAPGLAGSPVTFTALATAPVPPSPSYSTLSAGQDHSCAIGPAGAAYCWGLVPPLATDTNPMLPPDRSLRPVKVGGGITFASLAAGDRHTCALTGAGAAYCWGTDASGTLGQGSYGGTAEDPMAVGGGLAFAMLSAGGGFNCGVTTGGAGYCWGYGDYGQLGNGGNASSATPVAVSGGLTFAKVRAGQGHACGLTTGGAAYCWGHNGAGAVGDSTTSHRNVPVAVKGGLTFTDIAAGNAATCAVTAAGATYCWGSNGGGLLGVDTSATIVLTPRPVVTGVQLVSITTWSGHFCGLTSAGAAYCWGANNGGALGDGTSTSRTAPTAVSGGLVFTVLRAGMNHTCGATGAGMTYCWGINGDGQAGDGTTSDRNVPTPIADPAPVVASVVIVPPTVALLTGASTTLTATPLTAGGTVVPGKVVSWTSADPTVATVNSSGAVSALTVGSAAIIATVDGMADTAQVTVTAPPPGPPASLVVTPAAASVAVGATTPLVATLKDANGVTVTGTPVVWTSGATGIATVSGAGVVTGVAAGNTSIVASAAGYSDTATITVTPAGSGGFTLASISTGYFVTCGVKANGEGYCWGYLPGLRPGQEFAKTATLVPGGHVWRSLRVAQNDWRVCGVTTTDQGYCWGQNRWGEAGVGTREDTLSTPTLVAGGISWKEIHPGSIQTCGISTSGTTYCWGYTNYDGVLGTGVPKDTTKVNAPVAVSGSPQFTALGVGDLSACGVEAAGTIRCWGRVADSGQGGRWLYAPTIVNAGVQYKSIAGAQFRFCGVTTTDAVYCFGVTSALGTGSNSALVTFPAVAANLPGGATAVASDQDQGSCAIVAGGAAYCWGMSGEQSGSGSSSGNRVLTPVAVAGGHAYKAISRGGPTTCAIATDDVAWCWGLNPNYTLGDSTLSVATQPVKVRPPN